MNDCYRLGCITRCKVCGLAIQLRASLRACRPPIPRRPQMGPLPARRPPRPTHARNLRMSIYDYKAAWYIAREIERRTR
jgi:hypothetical protein